MARRRGQIPPYGKNFRLVSLPWTPDDLASRAYYLKRDESWFIRSDKTSEAWTVFYTDPELSVAVPIGKPHPTLTTAMARLLAGIEGGFYQVTEPSDQSERPETRAS